MQARCNADMQGINVNPTTALMKISLRHYKYKLINFFRSKDTQCFNMLQITDAQITQQGLNKCCWVALCTIPMVSQDIKKKVTGLLGNW